MSVWIKQYTVLQERRSMFLRSIKKTEWVNNKIHFSGQNFKKHGSHKVKIVLPSQCKRWWCILASTATYQHSQHILIISFRAKVYVVGNSFVRLPLIVWIFETSFAWNISNYFVEFLWVFYYFLTHDNMRFNIEDAENLLNEPSFSLLSSKTMLIVKLK